MSKTPSDREQVIAELEKYYQNKLDSVRARLGKQAPPDSSVNVRIDKDKKKITVCW